MKHVTRSSPSKDIKLTTELVANIHETTDDSFFLSQFFLTFLLSFFLLFSLFFYLYQEHTKREYDQQLNTDSYGLKHNKTN
jgi:cbb3-type cytochrome oxidase subunit 3